MLVPRCRNNNYLPSLSGPLLTFSCPSSMSVLTPFDLCPQRPLHTSILFALDSYGRPPNHQRSNQHKPSKRPPNASVINDECSDGADNGYEAEVCCVCYACCRCYVGEERDGPGCGGCHGGRIEWSGHIALNVRSRLGPESGLYAL